MTIQEVSRETGLSADTIRAWERRYGAVRPRRLPNNRRDYAPQEVRRLRDLRRAVERGHAISAIASLSDDELARLTGAAADDDAVLAELLRCVRRYDAAGLGKALRAAAERSGIDDFCDGIAAPLLREAGAFWLRDPAMIAMEHLATACVEQVLDAAIAERSAQAGRTAIFAAPAHDRHLTGAKMAAAVAAASGLRPLVLSAGSSTDEIAQVARRLDAVGAGISSVYVPVEQTLRELARRIAPLPLWIGGSLAPDGPWTRVRSMREFAALLNAL